MTAHSLRGRLVVSMSAAAVVGLGAVIGLHEVASDGAGLIGAASRLLLGDEWPEPWQDLAILLPFSLLIVLLASVVTRWNLRSVNRASEAAALVGPANPTGRIGAPGLPSEIEPLVRAANGALDRLAGAFETERRFTVDAAHELRTPLATLRLRLQRARSAGQIDWQAVERDLDQMGRLVAQLLELARNEAAGLDGVGAALAPCNLARLAREAAASMLPLIEGANRTLVVELADQLPVLGRPDDLRDLVRNLLENAVRHGAGAISLCGRRASIGAIELDVADEGGGVPPDLRDAVFDRFRKIHEGESGSGLGLAIVRAVARRHGATVGFVDGPGCRLRLSVPAADAATRPTVRLRRPGIGGAAA